MKRIGRGFARVAKFISKHWMIALVIVGAILGLVTDIALATVAIIELLVFVWFAIRDMRDGKYAINVLILLAILIALVDRQFWAALALVVVALINKGITSRLPHTESYFTKQSARYSLPFTLLALAAAIFAWALSQQHLRFLEVLSVATPFSLLIAPPIALARGLRVAEKSNITIRTGTILERLNKSKVFAFNKSGVLVGEPTVAKIIAIKPYSQIQLIGLAASIEKASTHPVARAIVAYAETKKAKLVKIKHVAEVVGRGMSVHYKNQQIIVGNALLLADNGIKLGGKEKVKGSAIYVIVDGKLAGTILLEEAEITEAKATLNMLSVNRVKHLLLLTGSNKSSADGLAKKLSIGVAHAHQSVADKLQIISELRPHPVVYVGDGNGDAPLLTASDVGISLSANDAADVIIEDGRIINVAVARQIARRTFRVATASIWFGVILSFALMAVMSTGRVDASYGAIAQIVLSILVILLAYQPQSKRKQ